VPVLAAVRAPIRARIRAVGLALALFGALAPSLARAQGETAPAPAAAAAPAPPPAPAAPAPIPIPEVIDRSDALLARLARYGVEIAPDATIDGYAESLEGIGERLKRHSRDVEAMLAAGARLGAFVPAERALDELRREAQAVAETLTNGATRLEAVLDELTLLRESWKLTRLEAAKSGAPQATLDRIDETVAAMAETRGVLRKRRARVLELQERASTDLTFANDTVARIEGFRQEFGSRMFRRDAPPIWRVDLGTSARVDILERFRTMLDAEWAELKRLLPQALPRLVLQALLFVGLYLAFRTGQRRTEQWREEDPTLEAAALVFRSPITAALLLTLVLTVVIHPRVPYLMGLAISLVALPAALHTLMPLVGDRLRAALYVVGAFFVVDRLRDVAAPAPEIEQTLLAVQLAIALLLLLALLRSDRLEGVHIPQQQLGRLRVLGWIVKALAVLAATALVATSLGFMQLARTLAGGSSAMVYAGFGLLAVARAVDGFVAFVLRVQPLCGTRSVQRHRHEIEQRMRRVTEWLAWGLFAATTLGAFQLWQPARSLLSRVAQIELIPGAYELRVGELVLVAAILWGAYQVSRFVAFVLESDVYPRLQLERGLPYAISTLTRYALLTLGFFLAISTLGIDLSKVTLLAGALGVGIGFGLQNIVNNFVSGLILLFERPIQVGDTVQIQGLTGEVRRIGMRSSTLRTVDGAEVIVPNGTLIQDTVTNWTLSDQPRRLEIQVGVAYGTEPQKVIAILRETASRKPELLKRPEPIAILVGFGESRLEFVLRCWLAPGEDGVAERSQLVVAVHDALRDAGIELPFPQRDVHLSLDAAAAAGLAQAAAGQPDRPEADRADRPAGGAPERSAGEPASGDRSRA